MHLNLLQLTAILTSARRVMTHNEVNHVTVARANALYALVEKQYDERSASPDTVLAAIMEACSAGIVGEDSGVTTRRAQAYYEFLNRS